MNAPSFQPGLRENLGQFLLLACINGFVGSVVGAQRSILPLAGTDFFGLSSLTSVTAFVVSFGVTKALMNLAAGALSQRFGRKRVLLAGWFAALPIPLLLLLAQLSQQWWLVVIANVFLGVNQGLCWTMTIVMKSDLAGASRRGLAMGVNECAGYTAVAASAFIVTLFATASAPIRGVIGISAVSAVIGLALTLFFVREVPPARPAEHDARGVRSSVRVRVAASQAGLVCNLNDAVIWAILPSLLVSRMMDVRSVGIFVGIYPATWGLAQLFTGWLSDRVGRSPLIFAGMLMQGAGHFVLGMWTVQPYVGAAVATVLLGLGTALAYPSLLAFVADHAPADWRSRALGEYRFFRDAGYAVGALAAGLIADGAGLAASVHASGVITVMSGVVFALLVKGHGGVPPSGTGLDGRSGLRRFP